MKTMKIFRLFSITAIVAVGLIFSLSNCKREKEIVVVTVHDSLKGKNISGICTYPDYTNTMVVAKGAVLTLYTGSAATGAPVASTYADATGNYAFKYLVAGNYFIKATYNTENVNYKDMLHGINFEFYTGITVGTSNIIQNIALATVAAPGALKIAMDTVSAGATFRKVTMESHTKAPWLTQHNGNQQGLQGGFNVVKFTNFIFDEANPGNILINAWVQTSSVNTFEPARDALGAGCVKKSLLVDTMMVGTTITPIPATDTIRFYANPGEVVKYGKGYLAHGHMKGFYHHAYGTTGVGGSGVNDYLPADTSYLQVADGIPYGSTIDKPVDMYFEYVSKIKQVASATSFQWMFTFEGTFTINKRTGWYVTGGPISDIITVTPHVTMAGTTNREY